VATTAAAAGGPGGETPLQKDAVVTGAHRSVYRYDGASRMVSSRVEMELSGVADVQELIKPVNPGGGRYRPAPTEVLPGGVSAVSRATFTEVALGRRTVSVTGPQGSRYLSHDVLCSVRVATTGAGQVGETYRYDAYGETLSGETSHSQPYGYNGKPRDTATGLINYGFRDYLPSQGRFVTVDPIKDGVNWYVYVNADPVNFVDAWGLDSVYASFDKSEEEMSVILFETNEDGVFTGTVTEQSFRATNNVRTPANRRFQPVLYNNYYMFPDAIPHGTWELGESQSSTDAQIGPRKVPTSAVREVEQYELDRISQEWNVTSVTTDGGI